MSAGSPMALRSTLAMCLSLWTSIAGVSGSAFGNECAATPDDLWLDRQNDLRSEALSHFAWGFFLQLDPERQSGQFLREYQKALELLPESKEVLDHLLRSLASSGQVERLVEYLRPVSQRHPESELLTLVLSEALVESGRLEEGVSVLEAALKARGGQSAQLVRALSILYWRAERYEAVERLLNRALRRRPLRRTFIVQHAAALYCYSMWRLPEEKLGKAVRKVPWRSRALAHARLAAARIDQAEQASDIDSLVQLLGDAEAWTDVAALLRQVLPDARFASVKRTLFYGESLLKTGQRKEGMEILDEVAAQAGLPPAAYAQVGQLYMQADELEKAVSVYNRLLTLVPDSPPLKLTMGYLYLRQGRPEKTLEVVERSRAKTEEQYWLVSRAHYQLNDYAAASQALLKAEAAAQKAGNTEFLGVEFLLYYAGLCEEMGLLDQAISKARQALALAPASAEVNNFLGYILADHGLALAEAEELISKAVQDEPENVAYLDSLAWVRYRQGDYARARSAILKAVRLSGSHPDPVILEHAGDICAAVGLNELAARYWWEALNSQSKNASTIRGKLEGTGVNNDPDGL